jgi:hypothetical protein
MSFRVPRDEAVRQLRKLRGEVLDVLREPKSKLDLLGEIGERGGELLTTLSDDPEIIGRWTELHHAAATPLPAPAPGAAPPERGGNPTTMSGRTAAEEMMRFLEDLCARA